MGFPDSPTVSQGADVLCLKSEMGLDVPFAAQVTSFYFTACERNHCINNYMTVYFFCDKFHFSYWWSHAAWMNSSCSSTWNKFSNALVPIILIDGCFWVNKHTVVKVYLFLCACVCACMSLCAADGCLVPSETRGGCWIPWNWSSSWLWASYLMWVLRSEHRTSRRVIYSHKSWVISPAPNILF